MSDPDEKDQGIGSADGVTQGNPGLPASEEGTGIIPEDDMQKLNELGVGKLFAPGTPTSQISDYITGWVKDHRSF